MQNHDSTGSVQRATFAAIAFRIHPSQSFVSTFQSLLKLAVKPLELYVLYSAGAALSNEESVLLSILGVHTHVREIDVSRLAEAVNYLAQASEHSHLVFLRAGDALPPNHLSRVAEQAQAYAAAHVFYSPAVVQASGDQAPVKLAMLPAAQFSKDWNFQVPCVLTGLCISTVFFKQMGGFHQGCQMVLELDFWLRTYLIAPAVLAHIPDLEVQVQPPSLQWTLKFGARAILEKCTLVRRFAGWCSADEVLDYARLIERLAQERPSAQVELTDHLNELVNSVAFMVHASQRERLQPWLRVSVQYATALPEFEQVDAALQSVRGDSPQALPHMYHGELNIHSLGSFCHAAQVLKELAVRRHTGPFDWIFSNAAAATHMLRDRFATYLDPQYFRIVPEEEKVDSSSNVCDHLYYKEQFGVKFMFNHHRPFEKEDGDFFRDAVQSFVHDLDSSTPCLLFHVARMNGKPEDFSALWDATTEYSAPKRMLVLRFVHTPEERFLTAPVVVLRHVDPEVLEFQLPVVSKTNGVRFEDPRDNRRLKRLVYSYAQIALSKMAGLTA